MIEDFWEHTNSIIKKYGYTEFTIDAQYRFTYKVDNDTLTDIHFHGIQTYGKVFRFDFANYLSTMPADATMYDALTALSYAQPNNGVIRVSAYTREHVEELYLDMLNGYKMLQELTGYWKTVKVVDVPQIGEV